MGGSVESTPFTAQEDGQGEQELPGPAGLQPSSKQLGNSACFHGGLDRAMMPFTRHSRKSFWLWGMYSNEMYQLQQMDAQKLVLEKVVLFDS